MCVRQEAECDPAVAGEAGSSSTNSVLLTPGLVERWACDPSWFCKTEAQDKGLPGKMPSPLPSQPEIMCLEEWPAGRPLGKHRQQNAAWGYWVDQRIEPTISGFLIL